MPSDIRLNDNTIDLADAEAKNTGPLAGYAFRDRSQLARQRWVLYSVGGHARLYADSRVGDVVTVSKDGLVTATGPQAALQVVDRGGAAKGNAVWYVDNEGANFEYTGPVQTGQVLQRLVLRASNSTGLTIFNNARVTGGLHTQGESQFDDRLSVRGDLVVDRNVKVGGTISQSSSAALKDDVEVLTGDSAMEALEELTPVTYRYKSDLGRRRNVGFIAEDAPDLVSHPDRDRLSPMDIVAVLTKVVKEQQAALQELRGRLDGLTRLDEDGGR